MANYNTSTIRAMTDERIQAHDDAVRSSMVRASEKMLRELLRAKPELRLMPSVKSRFQLEIEQESARLAAIEAERMAKDRAEAERLDAQAKEAAAKVRLHQVQVYRRDIERVAHFLSLDPAKIMGTARNRPLVHARAIVATVMTKRGLSLTQIARAIGYNNHTSVMHLLEVVRFRLTPNEQALLDMLVAQDAGKGGAQ
jgi:chromosomal replication initiation ATPase DnaA